MADQLLQVVKAHGVRLTEAFGAGRAQGGHGGAAKDGDTTMDMEIEWN